MKSLKALIRYFMIPIDKDNFKQTNDLYCYINVSNQGGPQEASFLPDTDTQFKSFGTIRLKIKKHT